MGRKEHATSEPPSGPATSDNDGYDEENMMNR